jgi:acetylglutamate kinase
MKERVVLEVTKRRDWLKKAEMIVEALPYMQRYKGEYVVIKYGGHAMGDDRSSDFVSSVLLLHQCGVKVVVVHGGGPEIGEMLGTMGIETRFERGLRYSDEETVDVAEMVLSGRVNKRIVVDLMRGGVKAVGVSGKDGGLVRARGMKMKGEGGEEIDLGYVGEVEEIDSHLIEVLTEEGMIPVVAPLAYGDDARTYNVNGDTMAGALAGALKAKRLLMLTDVEGVKDKGGELISRLDTVSARKLIEEGVITGGMLPKVETCISAVRDGGVEASVVLDGRHPRTILLELFTDLGGGTYIG